MPVARLPVTPLIGTSLFFTGVTYASTLNYGAIVGIDTLGIPNGSYAVLLMIASLASATASVGLGYLSDRVPDRRILIIGCALAGALGFGLIFAVRSQIAFIVATCVIMPIGGALFSQSFSFTRSHYSRVDPQRADLMISIMRTVFSVAWAIVPPLVGWVAATTSVFNVYGIAAAAYLVCAAIYVAMLLGDRAAAGNRAKASDRSPTAALARASIEPAYIVGTIGCALISIATYLNTVTVPLLITTTLDGSYAELGIFAGLAAAIELPFMVLWGYSLRRVSKQTIIVAAALLYAIYMVLLSRAGTVADVLWLQAINGPATAALMSIPISYLQDAIRGRVGLSTSLIDVVGMASALASAAIFGAVTTATPDYRLPFVIAAGLAAIGAGVLFTAHRVLRSAPAA